MKKNPRSSAPVIRALVALAVIVVGLGVWTFFPGTSPTPRLGLDLQGGTQVVLQPRATDGSITDAQVAQAVEIIRSRVNGLGVAEAEVTVQGSGSSSAIVVSVPGADQDSLVKLVGQTALLDFRPVYTVLNPAPAQTTQVTVPPASKSAAPSAKSSPASSAKPAASAAPSPNPSLSGKAGSPASSTPSPAATPSASASAAVSASAPPARVGIVQADSNSDTFQAQALELDCTDAKSVAGGTPDNSKQWLAACQKDAVAKYILEPAFITGTQVTGADAVLNQGGAGWSVNLTFDSAGSDQLATASQKLVSLPDCSTGQSPCNAFAIVLDGVVQSAPRFNQAIVGGTAQITGNFTAQQAKDLASVLKYGALPITLDVGEVSSVSATVGADQLKAGLLAGGLGLLIVAIYLLVYYRILGIVAVASLGLSAAVVYASLTVLSRTMGLTLTLAGVAGAIVAIGITADSFVVYFERLRDLTREGKSSRQAAMEGWKSARRTILAADFISILAAATLYLVSIGSVRGFAFVLGLTTAIDILIAFLFTHPVTVLLTRAPWFAKGGAFTGAYSLRHRTAVASRLLERSRSTDSDSDSQKAGAQ